ncbi:hypothetical protein [Algoriphagus algorifonticola]|uniref:hypothetical protein n=1 Tax=Algoriphagus algorifonticola TaxID=2593007 RepID=UPI0011A58F11|nr:hypothetical protein [Algoriphagus algorifonticola]
MNYKIKIILVLLTVLTFSCKDKDDTEPFNYEYFSVDITGDISGKIVYDESKYVGTEGESILTDDFDTYLMITATEFDRIMTLNFYPPDDNPRAGDVLSVTIRGKELKPWTQSEQYTTAHISQLQQYDGYAIVSYWNEAEQRDYVSYYRFENTSNAVTINTDGDMLTGEVTGLRLETFNGSHFIRIDNFSFRMRPGDEGLLMN